MKLEELMLDIEFEGKIIVPTTDPEAEKAKSID